MKKKLLAALGIAALVATGAQAQDWPTSPITLIAPFAPGGASDVLARSLADGMSRELGQSVIVENHAGAGGSIGVGLTAAARPDGHTIVLGGNGSLVFAAGVQKLPYDVRTDLRPIGQVGSAQSAIVTRKGLEVSTLDALIARAKETPKLTYGSPGVGSVLHLAGVLFGRETGGELVHVPYQGLIPALTDLQAGNIDMVFANIASLKPFLEGGRVTPVATISDERSADLPDLPTTPEEGFPNLVLETWYGVMAPADVPEDRAATLEAALGKVASSPEFHETLRQQGFVPASDNSAAGFGQVIESDFATWMPIIADLGIAAK